MPIVANGDLTPVDYSIQLVIDGLEFFIRPGGAIGDEEDTDTAVQKLTDLLAGSPDVSFVGGSKISQQAYAITATEE